MLHEHRRTQMIAWLLSMLAVIGGGGCLVTGFQLNVGQGEKLLLVIGILTAVRILLYSSRLGSMVLLFFLAGVAGFLTHQSTSVSQCLTLADRICGVYNSAYGWGIPAFLAFAKSETVDFPIFFWGCICALTVSGTILSRSPGRIARITAGLPLAACLVVTDTIPDALFLGMLLILFTMLSVCAHVRRDSPGQAGRLAAGAILPVALCLCALLWIFPKEEHVDSSIKVRQQLLNAVQAMKVPIKMMLPDEIPLSMLKPPQGQEQSIGSLCSKQSGTIYLRSRDYDTYSGKSWVSSSRRTEAFSGHGTPINRITIHTESALDEILIPYYPRPETVLRDGRLKNDEGVMAYAMDIYAPAQGAAPDANCLQIPLQTARQLQKIGTFSPEPSRAAWEIGEYLRSFKPYDAQTPPMPESETDFALWFLERAETGYCVHFATAAVLLLRSAGVPARYVTGFKVEASAGVETPITAMDAHAWAEFYDRDTGCWYPLEATPGIAEDFPVGAFVTEEEEPAKALPKKMLLPLFAFLGVMPVLLFLRSRIRLLLRRIAQHWGSPNRRALACWQEVLLLSRLLGQPPPGALKALAQKAKFSRSGITGPELEAFREYRRTCIASLRRGSQLWNFICRWYYCAY